jgi:hypothetical protein
MNLTSLLFLSRELFGEVRFWKVGYFIFLEGRILSALENASRGIVNYL